MFGDNASARTKRWHPRQQRMEVVVGNHNPKCLPASRRRAILGTILLALSSQVAWCQTARPTRIVVPYTAGSPSDLLTRLLVDEIGRTQSTAMIVENRAGASTAIGTDAVARAAPDGST